MAHSKFSPSASGRWLVCPASIRLSEGIEDTGGAAAQRGTEIHAQAEAMLLGLPEPHPEHYDVAAGYVKYVRQVAAGGELLIERRVHFDAWAPGGFGTADAIVLPHEAGEAHIVDLKTGQHIVSADTEQLAVYALGVIQEHTHNRRITRITAHVYQNGLTSSRTYAIDELFAFGERVKQAAEQALDPSTRPVPGAKQCQWCPARAICTARAVHVLSQAGERIGLADLAGALPVAQHVAAWADDVQARAKDALVKGATVSGYKLVEGQSRRKWRDDALELLEQSGLPTDQFTQTTLLPITAVEKSMGKKAAAPILALATEKPPGSPVLALSTDPRPQIAGGQFEDF